MLQWRIEFELDRINSDSWYHRVTNKDTSLKVRGRLYSRCVRSSIHTYIHTYIRLTPFFPGQPG